MTAPPLPTLLVSQAETNEKILAQIDRGLAITETLEAAFSGFGFAQDTVFVKVWVEQVKWANFTLDLLNHLFIDLPIGREFGSWEVPYSSPLSDRPRQLLKWMIEWIHSLESIIERVDLFPLAGKLVQTTATPVPSQQQSKDIFIVHGHDETVRHEIARFIEQLGLQPIILHGAKVTALYCTAARNRLISSTQ